MYFILYDIECIILIILLFNIVYFNKGINNVCIRSISSIDYVELN